MVAPQAGHVYVGVPPLYKVETGPRGKPRYCYDEASLAATTSSLNPGSYTLQRFKVPPPPPPPLSLAPPAPDPFQASCMRVATGKAASS